jgi:hypothetical protein
MLLSTLRQNLRNRVSHIPPHAPQNNFALKLTALEIDHAAAPPPRDQASSIAEHPSSEKLRQNHAASHQAVAELQREGVLPKHLTVRTNRYLNNVIEQDHRRVKQRVRSMLGFKRFDHALITIAGIELVHQIKKGQFDLSALCAPHSCTPQIWEAVLAA